MGAFCPKPRGKTSPPMGQEAPRAYCPITVKKCLRCMNIEMKQTIDKCKTNALCLIGSKQAAKMPHLVTLGLAVRADNNNRQFQL